MRIVIAPQAFKGSLTALEVCRAIGEGILRVFPQAKTVQVPMADGGDGTLEALVDASGGTYHTSRVTGPLGEPVAAAWGVMGDGETAVIEMARASGLALLSPAQLAPRHASTRGVGELVRAAMDAGCHRIIIGIGGSATNDGGVGMARALGIRFLDSAGRELPEGGAALAQLAHIDANGLDPRLKDCQVLTACDVNNPLTGPQGASAVYGPQKGASPEDVQELDRALARLAEVLHRDLGEDIEKTPGAGAAGGLGAGLMAFLHAQLRPGVDLVADAVGLDAALEGADLVLTGEGRIDSQTIYNKAPVGVARRARARKVPVIAVAGSLGEGYQRVYEAGIDGVEALVAGFIPLEEAVRNAAALTADATERALRLARLGNEASGWR